ncbi:hypothetical protein GCM10010300_36030 [Streptomyces olivaceoviridis]|nr:hypothetical protein GCM10010300_36030 [Streptomyces olivaceoviridis]
MSGFLRPVRPARRSTHAGRTRGGGSPINCVSPRIAVIAVGDPSRHDEGAGRAVLSRLRERALERHFPPGTVLAECDLDPGRLIRLGDHTDLTVAPQAARPRPGNAGRVHRLEPDARRLDRPNAVERVEDEPLRHGVVAARGADGVAMACLDGKGSSPARGPRSRGVRLPATPPRLPRVLTTARLVHRLGMGTPHPAGRSRPHCQWRPRPPPPAPAGTREAVGAATAPTAHSRSRTSHDRRSQSPATPCTAGPAGCPCLSSKP